MRNGTKLYHFLCKTGRNTTQNAPKFIIFRAWAPPCTVFVRAGGGCGRGWPPPVMGVLGYYPRKNLENLFKIVHFRVK